MLTRKIKWILLVIIMIGIATIGYFSLQGKSQTKQQQQFTIQTVKMQTITNNLYLDGTLEPLKIISVSSPVSGTIQNLSFHYGEYVENGQQLLIINSPKQRTEFQDNLTEYLKTKHQEKTDFEKVKNDKVLFGKGVISRNDYESSVSTYHFSYLDLLRAEEKLNKHRDIENILKISIDDMGSVNKILNLAKKSQTIKIYSDSAGIALFPSSSGNSNQKIKVGDSVKEGQLLVSIGDITGLTLEVKADENNINTLKVGQKATVSSSAFPGVTLNGSVVAIDKQAVSSYDSPQFSVKIVVPKITPEQEKVIRIGMTAKVAITLKQPPRLMIPLKAVTRNNDQYIVTTVNDSGNQKKTAVTTGITTQNEVAIVSGLKVGDKIVVPN